MAKPEIVAGRLISMPAAGLAAALMLAYTPSPLQLLMPLSGAGAASTPLASQRLPASRIAPRHSAISCDMPNIDGTGAFKNVQEYPCTLQIKCIGTNEGPFVSDIHTLCAELTGQAEKDVPVKWRDNGKYRAVTLTLTFQNADQVYAVYAAMDRDPRVKYKL